MDPSYIIAKPNNLPPRRTCLDDLPFWNVWALNAEDRKVAFNSRTGRPAKPNDARTFGTRAEAERAFASGKYRGLCILVDELLGITGGDLDHIVPDEHAFDESKIPPAVWRIIRIANTWTCWSPSGTGIRFIFSASLGRRYMTKNKAARICIAEAYSRLRFMTVELDRRITGTPDTFNADADDLEAWHEALGFPLRDIEQPPQPRPTFTGAGLTNEQILEKVFNSKNGDKIRRLHGGDTIGYPPSQSDPGFSNEADLAFVGFLSGYTTNDDQLADMWRSCGLYRKKLDRADYINRTIAKVRRDQTWWYDPNYGHTTAQAPPPVETVAPTEQPTNSACDVQLAQALKKIAQLERDRDTLIALLLNPHVTSAEKTAAAATIDRSIRKSADAEGYVTLKPGEIANDWRPKPDPGENTDPLNRDGSKPRMSRSSVGKTMLELTKRGLKVHSKKEDVEPKGGRPPYKETVWRVQRPENIADFLAPVAFHQPADMPTRKPRTIPPQCLECGGELNIKTWTVTVTESVCPDCGDIQTTESKPRTLAPIVTIDPAATRGDKFSPVTSVGTTGDKFSPNHVPGFDPEPDYWTPPLSEPEWLWERSGS